MHAWHIRSSLKPLIAAGISAALVAVSPGPFAYQAYAAALSGAAAAGRGARVNIGNAGAALHTPALGAAPLSLSPVAGLTPTLSAVQTPSAVAAALTSAAAPQTAVSVAAPQVSLPRAAPLSQRQQPGAAALIPGAGRLPQSRPQAKAAAAPAARKGLTGTLAAMAQRYAPSFLRQAPQAAAAASRRAFDGEAPRAANGIHTPAVAGAEAGPRRSGLQAKGELPAEAAASFAVAAPKPIYTPQGRPWRKTKAFQIGAPLAVGVGAIAAGILFPALTAGTLIGAGLMGSILLHEFAHLAALRWFGEPTAREHGFKTLNPLQLVDPLGTLVLPALSALASFPLLGLPVVLGWAKPVPVDFNLLKDPKRDAGWIALAGPASNLALAGLFGAAFYALPLLGVTSAAAATVTSMLALMNLALFAVNMLPLPWLDGFKVYVGFLMPQSLYQKWIYNPNVVTPYQKLYQRIYQGPSNILTRLNINTMEQVGGLTRALSIAVMGLVSAGLWMGLGVPFLFLALPCSYDYYCIREKVRSEQAVEEMMDLMSEWGALLVQIGEDHDAESEVSAYEAEHAMKNAVDQLLEDLMAKQSFRDLDDEEKIAEFMRLYPDMAVQFLKQKVFTEDSEDKIREILADERNEPMFKRVEDWLRKWDVFKKMSSPTEKKKFKDANEAADEQRKNEQGGGGSLGGFAALFGFALASAPAAVTGPLEMLFGWIAAMGIGAAAVFLAGTTDGGAETPRDGPRVRPAAGDQAPERFWIAFKEGVSRRQAEQALERAGLTAENINPLARPAPVGEPSGEPFLKAQVRVTDLPAAVAAATLLRDEDLVDELILHNDVIGLLADAVAAGEDAAGRRELFDDAAFGDAPPLPADAALSRAQQDQSITRPEVLKITLNRNLERVEGNNFLLENGLDGVQSKFWAGERELHVTAHSALQAAAVAVEMLRDHRVARVALHPSVRSALSDAGADLAAAEEAAAATAAPEENFRDKIVEARGSTAPRGRFWVHFKRGVLEPQARAIAQRLGLGQKMRNVTPHRLGQLNVSMQFDVNDAVTAGRKALQLAREAGVETVALHRDARNHLRLGQTQTASAAASADAAEEPDAAAEDAAADPAALPQEQAQKIVRGPNSQTASSQGEGGYYWAYVTLKDALYAAKNTLKTVDVAPASEAEGPRRFDMDRTEGTSPNQRTYVRVLSPSLEDLEAVVRALAAKPSVEHIEAFPALAEKLNAAAAESNAIHVDRAKLTADADAVGRLQVEGTYVTGANSLEEVLLEADNVTLDGAARRFRYTASTVQDAAQTAARWSLDGRVEGLIIHPDVDAHLSALEQLAAKENPTSKVELDENLADRKDMVFTFKDGSSDTQRQDFLNNHVLPRSLRYRWENGELIVHLRDMTDAGGVLAAAAANDHITQIRMNEMGIQAAERYKEENPRLFEFGPETVDKEAPLGVDEDRAVLVRFAEGAGAEAHAAVAEQFGLRLIETDYRGEERAVLYEAPEVTDKAFFIGTLRQTLAQNEGVDSLTMLREPELGADSAGAELAASLGGVEQTGPVAVPRRDAHAEWVKFLQEAKLIDGESNFTPKQIELLTAFLKPVAKPPHQKRHPVIGRVEEMKRAIRTLTGPRGRITSVMLTGEAGTGKTAIFEGLAQLMEDAEHADALRIADADGGGEFLDIARLRGRWFIELDIDRLLAEDDPVPILLGIMDLLPLLNKEDPRTGNRVLLLLDETQKLRLDPKGVKIMNALKGPIRDGRIAIAGTTTDDEWKEYFESDAALESRFRRIPVEEPTVEETIEMLRGAKVDFEWRHTAKIDDEALAATAKLTDEYWQDKVNPRKSFDYVLPDAAERMNPDVLRSEIALDIREGWRRLAASARLAARTLTDKGIASSISLAAETYNHIAAQIRALIELYEERDKVQDGEGHVTVGVIKRTIAELTGIEAGQLTTEEEDTQRFVEMEDTLRRDVVNQDNALLAVARAIRRNKSGLGDPTKPMGKFLFVGPTGVGKTHVVKKLAQFLFDDEEAMVRFDMSEFMEEHTYMRLVGAPPSYVGYEGGGQLTEAVRKRPHTVVLFDEIEKAHPKVWNIFLQILDDGRLTDSKGRTVDFKNTVIIFTSNIGMDLIDSEAYAGRIEKLQEALKEVEARITAGKTEGLGDLINKKDEIAAQIADVEKAWDDEIAQAIKESIKQRLKPELVNRLDPDPTSKSKWVRFNRLNRDNADLITQIELNRFKKLLLARHDTELLWDEDVRDFIAEYGFSSIYGARPLKETIEKFIVDPLAEWTLRERAAGVDVRGKRIHVTMQDGVPAFTAEDKPVVEIERDTLEGMAHAMTEMVIGLVEDMAADDLGESPVDRPAAVPDEAVFDKWLRGLRRPAPEENAAAAQPAKRSVFNPGARLTLPEGLEPIAGAHNNPKKADKTLRGEMRRLAESAKAHGYSEEAVDLLSGESFAKQFVRWAKARAGEDRAPVSLTSVQTAEGIRVVVESEHEMTADEVEHLGLHFSGKPPASLREAQQQVDRVNLTSPKIRDHNLLDLYRRIAGVPGARLGYATSPQGTQYWLEIPKQAPPAAQAAAQEARPEASSRGSVRQAEHGPGSAQLTPHQQAELNKAKDLLLRMLLSTAENGPAIMIAAAEAWAMLATPEDGAAVRRWMVENRWTEEATTQSKLSAQADMIMAAALWMKRFGTAGDLATLESLMQRFTDSSHFKVPARTSIKEALEEIYVRVGAERARAKHDAEGTEAKTLEAAKLALGRVGTMADAERVKGNAQAELDLLARWDPARLRNFYMEKWPAVDAAGKANIDDTYKKLSSDEKKLMLLYVARGTHRPEHDLYILHQLINGKETDRVMTYFVAEAIAETAKKLDLRRSLASQLEELLGKHTMTGYDGKWRVLLAYLYTAQRIGGPDVLPALEDIMDRDPTSMSTEYEQPYFETPMTWAKVVVRSGMFSALSQPRRGEDGSAKPSKIQEFLTSQRPMKVAAALYAIAYARAQLGGGAAHEDVKALPEGAGNELPDLYVANSEGTPNSTPWMGGGYFAGFAGVDSRRLPPAWDGGGPLPSGWGPGVGRGGWGPVGRPPLLP